MPLAIDLSRLAQAAQRVLGAAAPLPAKMMAASGIVPGAPAGDVVAVVAVLTEHEDAKVAAKAKETIAKLPPPILNGALGADLDPAVLVLLSEAYAETADVVER